MEDLTDDDREFYDERAGIAEFDGGLSRADAEAQAWQEMLDRKTGKP